MSQLRTVPGEDLSSRLSARGGSRARVGPQRSFYQRLGVSDPYGESPEVEEMAGNGLFSFLSAQRYYRELRGQRLRMMWRLGAIRHRQVAGERLRAAGPAFNTPNVLAGAALPTTGDLVLLDPKATPAVSEDGTSTFTPRRRGEPERRSRRAAIAATERSAGRSEPELARALAQLERLLAGNTRDRVGSLAREIQGASSARRAEVVREVVRVVQRETPRDLGQARSERGSRPLAVAAERTRVTDPGRRSPSEQGPRGLQPVLRGSPSVQGASLAAVERIARRPEAIERLARTVRSAASPAVTEASRAVLASAAPAPAQVVPGVPRTESARWEPRHRRSVSGERTETAVAPRRAERDLPTARLARAAISQAIPEAPGAPRGLDVAGGDRAPTLARVVARSRAGDAAADTRAPVSGSATSWLSDAAHPQRRVTRALAVASAPSLLEVAPTAAPTETAQPGRARPSRADGAPATRRRPSAAAPEAQSAPSAARVARSDTSGPSLRAVSRAIPDGDRIAASPIRVRVPQALTLPRPLQASTEAPEVVVPGTRRPAGRPAAPAEGRAAGRRGAVASAAPVPRTERIRSDAGSVAAGPTPSRRAFERVERQDAVRRAIAPLAESVTSVTRPASVQVAESVALRRLAEPRTIAPNALDLVALTPAAARDDQAPATGSIRRRDRAPAGEAVAPRRAATTETVPELRTGARRGPAAAARPPVPVGARPVASDAATEAEAPRARRGEHRATAPATRRALHRLADPAVATERERVSLTASPASFVFAARAQQALDAEPESTPTRRDRSATRALARSTRTARVDEQDRARLAPAATDYLPVAAAAEALAASPARAARRVRATDAVSPETRRSHAEPAASASERVRPATTIAADAAPEPVWIRRLATATAAARADLTSDRLDLTDSTDVAVRPTRSRAQRGAASEPSVRARRDRPVVDMRDLAPVQASPDTAEVGAAASPRRRPSLSASLRQVAGAFRAAERDSVQVVTLDAARRAIGAAPSVEPTINATLERDDAGQLVLARATRLMGEGAGDEVTLSAADLGARGGRDVPAGARRRAAARSAATDAPIPGATRAPRVAHGAPSVLARSPLAWADDRADATQDRPAGGGVAASPVREAGRRWSRPVPEGPVLAPPVASDEDPSHRLTAPLSARRRGARPDWVDLEAPERDEAGGPRRRAAHGANTWVDLEPTRSGRRAGVEGTESAPGWARRVVEPSVAERAEHEPAGSRVRSGGGLLTALARAGEAEDIVRVILERSHETAALARELGGSAGSLLHEVAAAASAPDAAPASRARASRGETVESTTVGRGRASTLLGGGGERSRGFRTRGGHTATSEAHDGVGSSNVMKLASKLKKLIHLAEHERRLDDARSQVRMAEESASARAEVGAGKSGGQGLEEDNMHIERLREEILREVQHQLEMTKQRGDSDVGNGWW